MSTTALQSRMQTIRTATRLESIHKADEGYRLFVRRDTSGDLRGIAENPQLFLACLAFFLTPSEDVRPKGTARFYDELLSFYAVQLLLVS